MLRNIFSAVLPASLASLVLFTRPSLATLSEHTQCLRTHSAELSTASACGHTGSLDYCFSIAPDNVDIGFLRQCFVNAGCEFSEAVVESDWMLRLCNDPSQPVVELRRRLIREEAGLEDAAVLVPRASTTSSEQTSATDAATTTSGTSATTSDSSTAASSATSASSTTATSTGSTSTSLKCSTTTYISTSYCPTQSTGTASGSTLSCYSTTTPTETCAAGLLCLTDSDTGDEGCMVPEGMGTWGVVVSIYFGVFVGVALIAICTASCREKRRDKKLHAEWEAAAAAKAAAEESKSRQRRKSQMTMASRRGSSAGLMDAPPQ